MKTLSLLDRIFKKIPFIKDILGWSLWAKYTRVEWIILVIGVITIFITLTALFTSLQDHTPPPTATHTFSIDNQTEFENTLASSLNSTVEDSSPITILRNGQEFVPDLLAEIKNAKKSIHIIEYIWEDGEFGTMLFQALISKAKSGVEVRLLLDGLGGRKASEKYIKELRYAGGKVEYFRPLAWWDLTRIYRRSHTKSFIIDGKIAYIGGVGIGDKWLGDATTNTSWHDFMFKMDGNMAARSQKIFANYWSLTTGEMLVGDAFYPPLPTSSPKNIQKESVPHFISLFSAPSPDMFANMEHFLWFSVTAAEHSIHIENPYLIPSKALLKALEEKAMQGVDVEIIVPGNNTDSNAVKLASRSSYTDLLKAGVKIYEYQPSRIHAKIITIDGKWSIFGSANLDNRSSQINLETIMGVRDENFARNLEIEFEKDKSNSKEVKKETWKSPSKLLLPLELLSRFFVKQY